MSVYDAVRARMGRDSVYVYYNCMQASNTRPISP